jgi:hypothetical protein
MRVVVAREGENMTVIPDGGAGSVYVEPSCGGDLVQGRLVACSMLALWMHRWVSADGWIWGVDGEDGVWTRLHKTGIGWSRKLHRRGLACSGRHIGTVVFQRMRVVSPGSR